jgi:hypothetical protein
VTPDQRPTDLGVNDGGFDFRGTDDAREFIWSQTQWIEVTEVRYGTHAGRPNPLDVVNGALYVEFDRGGAIYQNQNNVWKYLAGTMWGTLSPDQRPSDLGVNDAGFDFRATDQQREFIWSQTAWVEVTPVTGALNLTHPNVVTKVGTAGQIVEGGITDQSAANSDHVHITAAGNVGIGTPSAAAPLEVNPPARATAFNAGDATTWGDVIVHNRAVGPGTATGIALGINTGTFSNAYSGIAAVSASSADYDAALVFITRPPGAVAAERMWITSTGGFVLLSLPSANPGAGSKQLWYDPADGNRVKYAP